LYTTLYLSNKDFVITYIIKPTILTYDTEFANPIFTVAYITNRMIIWDRSSCWPAENKNVGYVITLIKLATPLIKLNIFIFQPSYHLLHYSYNLLYHSLHSFISFIISFIRLFQKVFFFFIIIIYYGTHKYCCACVDSACVFAFFNF